MHRLSNGTQVGALPTPAPISGSPGFASGGVPGIQGASDIDYDQWNSFQEELAHVVESAGITLSKTDNTQLLAAINHFVAASFGSIGGRHVNHQVAAFNLSSTFTARRLAHTEFSALAAAAAADLREPRWQVLAAAERELAWQPYSSTRAT